MSECHHPKPSRALLHGYDVTCDACGSVIGRVALFPCAVLSQDHARAALDDFGGRAGREARALLEQALRTPGPSPKRRAKPQKAGDH